MLRPETPGVPLMCNLAAPPSHRPSSPVSFPWKMSPQAPFPPHSCAAPQPLRALRLQPAPSKSGPLSGQAVLAAHTSHTRFRLSKAPRSLWGQAQMPQEDSLPSDLHPPPRLPGTTPGLAPCRLASRPARAAPSLLLGDTSSEKPWLTPSPGESPWRVLSWHL